MSKLKISGLTVGAWSFEENSGDYHVLYEGSEVFYLTHHDQDGLEDLAALIAAMAALEKDDG